MFVLTAKLSKPKLIAAGVILLAAILLIILLATAGGSDAPSGTAPIGETNDDRVAYLATFGWSVNAEPTQTQKVKIPDTTENKVFARYNDLQKSQGFDLTDYAGKEVMRYVYEILNYPDASAPVYASVLVCDGRVIGGDITNSAPDGVIHGFAMPQKEQTPSASAAESSAPTEESTSSEPSEAE
ncbi:MAG: DUF4830 domain-containing protein [Faecousia sp.]